MILSASFSAFATDSMSIAFISPSISIAGPAVSPHPPRITERKFLFIALHIMYESIAPEDPTKAPVTINKSLPSIKPVAAAAQPEYEFNIETTTGISAPPIARTKCAPIINAIIVIIINVQFPL